MTDTAQPDAYLVAEIHDTLAHDPRVAELGISVTIAGGRVVLSGEVATPERKAAVGDVVRPLVGDRAVHNTVSVTDMSQVATEEPIP